jgi:hypothetical protein
MMHKVYSHSYCNILATAVVDGSVGLFFERDTPVFGTMEVEIDLGISKLSYVKCTLVDLIYRYLNFLQGPINIRG